jgi:multidrug resistance efflux pump
MNRTLIVAPVVLAALLTGGYFIDRARDRQQSQLSGYFENQPTQVSSRLGGRVSQILVKEGDSVRAGQLLVRFEDDSSISNYKSQLQGVEQAKQQALETSKGPRPEDIAKQSAAVREAQANLQRLINGPLPEEIKTANDKFAEAKAMYRKAMAGPRPEELAAAQAAASVSLEKYRQAQRGLTAEERAQLKARLDSAVAAEELAKKQRDRSKNLYEVGAIPKQDLDHDQAAYDEARAAHRDAQEAFLRAEKGTPPEELAQARDAYKQAQAQLDLVRAGVRVEDREAARREMLAAQENLRLLMAGSRQEDIRAARARLDQASASLAELQRGNRPEDVAKAKAAAKQAELQAKSTHENLRERMVFAPMDGVVDRILVADGDLLAPNAPVIQESNPSDIWLRVYIPEADLHKVKLGDSAELAFDGFSDVLQGVVENISTSGEFTPANLQSPDERATQVFAIRIRLAQPDARVRAGMYATVRRVGQWP